MSWEPLHTALVWYVGLLDRMPDLGRALIAGGLLVLLLHVSRRRVPAGDIQFSLSFWKVSLIVLVIAPLMIWLLPVSRFSVLVDRLEPATPASALWLVVPGVWAGGFIVTALLLAVGYRRSIATIRALPLLAEAHPMIGRLRHWQRRLNAPPLPLALAAQPLPAHLAGARRLVLPRAAEHWPLPAVDLLILQALCRQRKRQSHWHLFAQFVACGYWPLPWVRRLDDRLQQDFHIVADNLAAACYQDEAGYRRALRQLEQRLAVAPPAAPAADREPAEVGPRGSAYLAHLQALIRPQPQLAWNGEAISRGYEQRRSVIWTEPGERLALLIGQSILVAVVAGGVTLKEIPPKVERDYTITLSPTWMNTAFPDHSRYETPAKTRRRPTPDPGDDSQAR